MGHLFDCGLRSANAGLRSGRADQQLGCRGKRILCAGCRRCDCHPIEPNPKYGFRGLELLAAGENPEAVLNQFVREDDNFDGAGVEARQVGIVTLDGRSAFYTGTSGTSALGRWHARQRL